MAELVDAADSKSAVLHRTCGFESHSRYLWGRFHSASYFGYYFRGSTQAKGHFLYLDSSF